MFVSPTGPWAEDLRRTLRRVYDPTTRAPVPWLLSGEAALNLQGVHEEPDMIEFRAISQYAVAYFSQFMRPYELPTNSVTVVSRQGGNNPPSDNWRSNVHQRIVAWSGGGRACWLGRWTVSQTNVQVSFTRSIHADPTTLALQAKELRRARFDKMDVPVTPIEFLLAESAQRNDTQLTHRILHVLRARGYSTSDLETALSVLPAEKASRLSRLVEFSLIAG